MNNDRYFLITVDVEPDWFNKKESGIVSIDGLHFLQDECSRYGMIPTYLVTYAIATREKSLRVIRPYLDQRACEVGHHLHIWETPPFENANSFGVDEHWIQGIQSEIPDALFERKMLALHEAIEKNFGIAPTSHRAGRWSVDERTLSWLIEHHYRVDSSICSGFSWAGTKGVNGYIQVDSTAAPNSPYYPNGRSIAEPALEEKDALPILEVPITCIKGDVLSNSNIRGMDRLVEVLNHFGYIGFKMTSFRPSSPMSLKVFKKATRRLFQSNLPLINLMFHSTELVEGMSPYSKTGEQASLLRNKISFALECARDYRTQGITLSQAADYF
jgi:hypothetical protein